MFWKELPTFQIHSDTFYTCGILLKLCRILCDDHFCTQALQIAKGVRTR